MRRVHLSWAVKQSSSPQSGSSLVFSASGLWSLLTDYCSLSLSDLFSLFTRLWPLVTAHRLLFTIFVWLLASGFWLLLGQGALVSVAVDVPALRMLPTFSFLVSH